MNERMLRNPVTDRNVKTLQKWGCHFIGPQTGRLACAAQGIGRMSEPDDIINRILQLLAQIKPKRTLPNQANNSPATDH